MRFLIVFLLIGGAGVYAWKTLHGEGPRELIGSGIDRMSGGLTTAISPSSSKYRAHPQSPDARPAESTDNVAYVAAKPAEEEKAMQVVHFRYREVPAAESILIAQAAGCTLSVDAVSRSVVIYGPISGVDACKRYLESVDVVAGSCAVQAWAVYVDKSAQRGFDLVAAIQSVTGSGISASVGGGGLTVNASAADVALALTAICDGSVVQVVQRPHVQLQQGAVSRVESIQEVPVPETQVSQGISQTSVIYRKVGLQLSVEPYFLGGDQLRLAVQQTNGLIGQTVRIGDNEVPVIQSQTVNTSVQMAIGETVVLGGVTTLRERTNKGLLRTTHEVSEGTLYVVLSTYYDVPKCLPVPLPRSGVAAAPLAPPDMMSPDEWIMGELLPAKAWQREEVRFLEGRK